MRRCPLLCALLVAAYAADTPGAGSSHGGGGDGSSSAEAAKAAKEEREFATAELKLLQHRVAINMWRIMATQQMIRSTLLWTATIPYEKAVDASQLKLHAKYSVTSPVDFQHSYSREMTRQIWAGLHRFSIGEVYLTWLRLRERAKHVQQLQKELASGSLGATAPHGATGLHTVQASSEARGSFRAALSKLKGQREVEAMIAKRMDAEDAEADGPEEEQQVGEEFGDGQAGVGGEIPKVPADKHKHGGHGGAHHGMLKQPSPPRHVASC